MQTTKRKLIEIRRAAVRAEYEKEGAVASVIVPQLAKRFKVTEVTIYADVAHNKAMDKAD